jgi:cytochrome c peroxidase
LLESDHQLQTPTAFHLIWHISHFLEPRHQHYWAQAHDPLQVKVIIRRLRTVVIPMELDSLELALAAKAFPEMSHSHIEVVLIMGLYRILRDWGKGDLVLDPQRRFMIESSLFPM